jgi:hypothetical protein
MESTGAVPSPLAKLPCMNCKVAVEPEKAKVFMGVFCCEQCHEIATRQYQRLERELRAMLTLTGETIRLALIEGRMHLSANQDMKETPKSELLRSLIDLAEKRAKLLPKETP